MPNAKHKEKVKETSDVLKDCREVLHDGSNEIVAQMLAFMNRVDGRLKQIETQVNKIDEVKSSLVNITRKVSSLEFTVKELKEKNIDIENSTQVMSDLFEDVKHNCSSNKTEIDTLKRRFEEVVERTSIRREELREHRQEQENMKTDITDLKCRSMKNNLIFTGLFESPREYTEGILREFIKNALGIEEYIELGNVHRFGRRETPDRKPRPIVARFIYYRQLTLILQNAHKLRGTYFGIREQFPAEVEEKRRTLYPVVRDCKQKGLRTKLVRDRLFIENKLYDPSNDLNSPHRQDRQTPPQRQYSDAAQGHHAVGQSNLLGRPATKRRRPPSTPSQGE